MQISIENQPFRCPPRIWFLIILAIFSLNILRGIRFPNMWSYTHFLFNYDFGFIRRGLTGTIIGQSNNPYFLSYDFFLLFSVAIFCINILLISSIIMDIVYSRNPLLIGAALIFSSSLGVVFLAHTIGYFDHIGLLIALLTIKTDGFYRKIFLLLILVPCMLLIHEAFLVLFFPVIFISLLLEVDTGKYIAQLIVLALFSIATLVLTFFVSSAMLEPEYTIQMYNRLQPEVEAPLREGAFDILSWSTQGNFKTMIYLWTKTDDIKELYWSFASVLPVFLTLIYFFILILKQSNSSWYLMILAVLASLSPLLLHFFGWDMHRWNTLTITTSFLTLYVLYNYTKSFHQLTSTPQYIYPIVAFILYFNGISSIPLFDNYQIKYFPFLEHFNYINDVIQGQEIFPYIPPS